MTLALTAALVLTGVGLVGLAVRRFFTRRFASSQIEPWAQTRAGRATRFADRSLFALGGLGAALLVAPDVAARLIAGFTMAGWRVAAVVGLCLTGALLVAVSRPVTALVRAAVTAAASHTPSWTGWKLRRQNTMHDFPRDWASLLEYDRRLCRQFLAYDDDFEAAVNLPAMRDYSFPPTRAALTAMLACDRVRTDEPPWFTRDVITTAYGRAVAGFAVALAVAEERARALATADLDPTERARLFEATAILEFVQRNATTPADRDRAYRDVMHLLAVRPDGAAPTGSAHPLLSVRQRSNLNRLVSSVWAKASH
jgi:hypothetical protein